MSKFIRNLSIFIGGLPMLMSKDAGAAMERQAAVEVLDEPMAVQLRPLNLANDNLFAGHRSHSSHASHASHASHYSGAGGSGAYVAPAAPSPQYPQQNLSPPSPQQNLNVQPLRAPAPDAAAVPNAPSAPVAVLSHAEKLKLQIMRVQIALTTLGLYQSGVNGTLTPETQEALRLFQGVKNIPQTGLMTTPTMNALGVPVVN